MLTASKYMVDLVNGEPGLLVTPRDWALTGTTPGDSRYTGLIYCHGHGGDATEPWHIADSSETMRALQTQIINKGIPMLSCYLGGNKWGNSEVITKLDSAVNYMTSAVGTKPGRIALMGHSMGHLAVMNWARINKAKVACVVSSMGVTDLNDIQQQASYGSEIAAAYPNGAADWNSETYNPMVNAGTKFAGIPWQGWIGDNDTVAKTANMRQFGALLGYPAEVNVVPGSHSWGTVGNWDAAKITAFITRHIGID